MSNRAYIETVEVKRTYGDITSWNEVRVYDDYEGGEVLLPTKDVGVSLEDDLSILQYCDNCDESIGLSNVIDSLFKNKKGITINGTWYDWDEIKHIFKQDE